MLRRFAALSLAGVLAFGALMTDHATARPARCKVRRGDTLSEIAQRYDVSTGDLRRWNHIPGDRIKPGDELHLKPATRRYEVRKGETLNRIAKRNGSKTSEVLAINPDLDPRRLRAGQVILLPGGKTDGSPVPKAPRAEKKKKKSEKRVARTSKRRPSSRKAKRARGGDDCPGKLARVPKHIGYRRRHSVAAWATGQTNEALTRGFDYVLRRHRLAPRVEVLDASRHDLGPVGNHRSHQEGRDVDISYYQKVCPRSGCRSIKVAPSQLDVRRQWTLLHYWLRRGDVEMVFIDHGLQKKLRAQAKRAGVSERQLDEWFQYPRSTSTKEGVIRHWPGHKNHLHVRFRTVPSRKRCKR